ncbi:ATP-binding cassette domain-containing protein [Parasalinivibrio latis]|uniref:ATP-binding cassette domain-containing protein n=1 Tax=Parasalinivibrio latis TaxID=2952610 RepID=UPI0030E5CEC4
MQLHVKNLSITSESTTLLEDLTFDVSGGEVITIMGPSGCGKSTLLSALAGHLSPVFNVSGNIDVDGDDVAALPAEKRAIGILFQDDLLFPHLNVWQNLAFGISSNHSANEKQDMAMQTLTEIGLSDIAWHAPQNISGGQRARISLMRTLLSSPKVLLLDEPFSKLDRPLRKAFRQFVFSQITQRNIATVMVTHDEDDVPPKGKCIQWPKLPTTVPLEESNQDA